MSDCIRLRPELAAFEPYSAGLSIDEIARSRGLSNVIKLASNENPLGASPMARKRLEEKAGLAFRYPQAGNPRLRQAIAAHWGVPAASVVCGNGSDEIIDLLVRVACVPGRDAVLACDPCFSIYELQAKLCGVELVQVPLPGDLRLPLDELSATAGKLGERVSLVFVTSPDNPSGLATPRAELLALARSLPSGAVLVVDEAYVDFCDEPESQTLIRDVAECGNIVVLRTFSKAWGLAGLRLGFGVLPPLLADALMRVRLPFSVNLLAEEAGLAVLQDEVFYRTTLDTVATGRVQLSEGLTALGCRVTLSQANFLLFAPPAGSASAKAIFEALLDRGIIIRTLAGYGLPDHLRVSVGAEHENRAFLQAFEEVLHG